MTATNEVPAENNDHDHDIGYTKDEMDLIKLFLQYADAKDESWTDVSNKDDAEITYKNNKDNPINMARGVTNVEYDHAMNDFYSGFDQWQMIKDFDPMCKHVEMIHNIDENRRILYVQFKSPAIIWDRDMCYKEIRAVVLPDNTIVTKDTKVNLPIVKQEEEEIPDKKKGKKKKKTEKEEKEVETEEVALFNNLEGFRRLGKGKKVVTIAKSICKTNVHYKPEEENSKHVRAELLVGGYLLEDLGEGLVKGTYLIQFDPTGWIPTWVSNLIAPNQARNVLRLRQHCEKLKKQREEEEAQEARKLEEEAAAEKKKKGKKK